MYTKSFYIEENIGNNALSFFKREKETGKKSKLFVPSLKKIENFSKIHLLEESDDKITFQDFGFDDALSTNFGLENFYEMERPHPNPLLLGEGITQKIFLFDNHNHAYYFWYLARNEGIVRDNSLLYHVDEHADYRDAGEYLMKPDSLDLQKVFEYTNFSKVNVGNYIISAEKEGLIGKTVQIRSEKELESYLTPSSQPSPLQEEGEEQDKFPSPERGGIKGGEQTIILNLDLDFFQPDLDFIDYELKKKVILDIASKADVITVATSPFFIDQKLALRVFKDLFYK